MVHAVAPRPAAPLAAGPFPDVPVAEVVVPAARIDRLLRREPVLWLSSVRPEGLPHVVPIWFSWTGEEILIASKPGAQKVRNVRANPAVMLALGVAEDDFDVGLLEGLADLPSSPSRVLLPDRHVAKYRSRLAAMGLADDDYLESYAQVIRIRPTRFLDWHGRSLPASARPGPLPALVDRLLRPIEAPDAVGAG